MELLMPPTLGKPRLATLSFDRKFLYCIAGFFVLVVLVLPYFTINTYVIGLGIQGLIYVLLALGLNVVVGYAGLLDLGYVAFYAVGAYTSGILTTKFGWQMWQAVPAVILACIVAGIVIGGPTLRLRSDYLAIVTLGFGEIIRITAQNLEITGGPSGIFGIPTWSFGDWSFNDGLSLPAWSIPAFFLVVGALIGASLYAMKKQVAAIVTGSVAVLTAVIMAVLSGSLTNTITFSSKVILYYFTAIIVLVLGLVGIPRLAQGKLGRAWKATRDDEDAAEAMGINTYAAKITAYIIGAVWAGIAGQLNATYISSIAPGTFQFLQSALVLMAVVIGGMGSIPGVVVGGLFIFLAPELLRDVWDNRYFAFGILLLIVMIFRPKGLWPATSVLPWSRDRRAKDKLPSANEVTA
ncbi:MAG: hypothetical protein LBR21_04925 [Propionibacteriaceae bacterium]|jgi:branched-chain amino acid transport system permease protein|nr:hypothetical protein [Propionibacteriaceae bacterium]